ncbi:MAG: polyprenyl synthetase family protein [Saprospiraceae bacterium]|nr:polyprenyl synthetase family protein [Saprospiraceae bacterium]
MQTLRQFREEFEAVVHAYCAPRTPSGLYDPVGYILQLGGKRIRPMLCLSGYLFGRDEVTESLWRAALALEVFHNFSLVHDDIMDQAPLRRGRPTVHESWNVPTAILSGDVMLIDVYRLLSQAASTEQLPIVLDRFHRTAIGVCEGQQLDMDFEEMDEVNWEDYLRMIRGKTAILLGGALEIGALLGGVPEEKAAVLARVGEDLGMSFQLMDDWLDVFGDPEKTGKLKGGDILRGKKTALVHQAMAICGEADRRQLREWYQHDRSERAEADAETIVDIFETSGARESVQTEAKAYHREAIRQLDGLAIEEGSGRACLEGLMRELQGRES